MQQTACFTLNVGGGGFCVGIVRVLPPGTEVEGTIDINGTPVPFTGSVAWAKAGDPRLGVRGLMGVRYADRARGAASTGPTPETSDDEVTEELPLEDLRAR